MRAQLAGTRPLAALSATAGTAAPAPAAAPRTQSGGRWARKSADSARISTRPGTMKQAPPTIAPSVPRSLQAQKIAELGRCRAGEEVDSGDGVFELGRGEPVVLRDAHPPEQGDMGGRAPNAVQPRRPHSRAMSHSGTRTGPAPPRHYCPGSRVGLLKQLVNHRAGQFSQCDDGLLQGARAG